jgi:hypothetical protein
MSRSSKSKGRPAKGRQTSRPLLWAGLGLALAALIGWLILRGPEGAAPAAQPTTGSQAQGGIAFPHIHGMGFSGDGRQLLVAAHDGLRVFEDGAWHIPPVPAHDYMGYSAVDTGFYSSGHPQTSDYVNPFGLIKSVDGGETLVTLGFAGESDFHVMGVGYKSHAIYVFSSGQSSRLGPGLHYSLDDGKTWQQSAMGGVSAQPGQLAVHPTDPAQLALATPMGLLRSSDYGTTFTRVGSAEDVQAVAFSPDGARILFGGTRLMTYTLASGQLMALQTPAVAANDGISALAISPAQGAEIAYATHGRDIQLSRDGGQSWAQIARLGQGLALP